MADLGAVRLAWQALRFRRGVSASVLVVAAVTVGAAAVGPIFARASSESMLRDRLLNSQVSATGIRVQQNGPPTPAALAGLEGQLPPVRGVPGYPIRIRSLQLDSALARPRDNVVVAATRFVWREGACGHLRFEQGGCPSGPGTIAVSTRSAREYGWPLGTRLLARGFRGPSAAPLPVTVAGLYRPVDPTEQYWFDLAYFNARQNETAPDVDSVFVDQSTMRQARLDGRVLIELPLDVGAVRLHNVDRARQAAENLTALVRRTASDSTTTNNLGALLDTAAAERQQLVVLVTIVTLQLLVLGYLVLYLIVANSSDARGPELALARLRGGRARSALAFGLLEPVVLLVLAAPLGLAAAVAFVQVVAHRILLAGTPVSLPPGALLAGLGAVLGGVIAAGLAARRTLSSPVAEQLRRAPGDRAAGGRAAAVDMVVITLSIAGLLELRLSGGISNGKVDNLALLAPGLLALAAALLGVRLLPLLGGLLVGRTRSGRDVGTFLGLRQVVRRPAGLRVVVLLGTALGLATFAVAVSTTSAGNRQARAATEVGADRVVIVEPVPAEQLVQAVHRLDPDGRWAMAAQQYQPYGGEPGGSLVAVDSPRLPAVATWRSDFATASLPALASTLYPSLPPPVIFNGRGLRVRVLVTRLTASVPLQLHAIVATDVGGTLEVDLGRLTLGQHDYAGTLTGCSKSCRLVGLTVVRPLADFSRIGGTLVISQLASRGLVGWTAVPAGLDHRDRWQPTRSRDDSNGIDSLLATTVGLRYDFTALASAPPGVAPVDAPAPLPAVTTPKPLGDAAVGQAFPITGLDGEPTTAQAAGLATVLPRVQDDGTMVDLTYAGRSMRAGLGRATSEIWLGGKAPANAPSLISGLGLRVVGVDATSEHRTRLDRSGPALALHLFLAGAALAAVLAAAGTVVSVYLTGRRRSFEMAALQAAGLTRGSLLRAAVVEQLLLLLTGLVVGTAAGLAGAVLALPSVPTFVDGRAVPALRFGLHAVPLVALVAGIALLLTAVAMLAGSALVRSAVPSRLREAQQ